ncbi:FAD-dependent thymidylate synthase [Fortiea sp. LEGE XX443]|nr:FAD-dependent thymidylate synthase [Fortiea sp. LEGE XX443]MBE9004843.1 FAD-dependent thymidylate synthase [Fortiea sp. LEGE XX443]
MHRFRVEVIAKTPNPQQVIYAAMHQDYTDAFVVDERDSWPSESQCGEVIVKRLLAGERGHYGPLEHPQIVFNCGYFPHSVMQQARTHRVGVSFDVQCLSGDSEVTFVKTSGGLTKIKISELYDLWTNGEKAVRERKIRGRKGEEPGTYRRDCKTRLQKMKLRVLNEETGIFELGHIKEVFDQGLQPVYRLTLEDGKTLNCTENHRLLTEQGWQTMKEALELVTDHSREVITYNQDCYLMTNGVIVGEGLYRDKTWLQEQLSAGLTVRQMAEKAGCSIEAIKKWVYFYDLKLNKCKPGTKNPWNKGFRGAYQLNLTSEQRQQRRERSKHFTRRGEDSNFWKGGVTEERVSIGAWTRTVAPQVHEKFDFTCQSCGVRGGSLHAHHLLPVYSHPEKGYDFENLVTVCQNCHRQIHNQRLELEFAQNFVPIVALPEKPKPAGRKLKAHPIKVVQVRYLGMQKTYDLEVDGKWHNFVANGVVVHNSFRYTGNQFIQIIEGKKDIEDVFYLRPVGYYTDRQGKKYYYSPEQRAADLEWCLEAAKRYAASFAAGMSEEHARGIVPFDYRQHFIVSFNLRSFLHFCDLRNKKDAQLEIQKLCELMWPHFTEWTPAIAQWYEKQRLGKARLAP